VRIKRVDFVADITDSVYRRMESERKQVANELRATGGAEARRSAPTPTASAKSSSPRPTATRRRSRARATPSASALYAEAFGRDPQFAQFYRSLEAYRSTFRSKSDVMVIDPGNEFFREMRGAATPAARR
jgi:modulator of FtsH protease HflC